VRVLYAQTALGAACMTPPDVDWQNFAQTAVPRLFDTVQPRNRPYSGSELYVGKWCDDRPKLVGLRA
jgi:hypothetical protein